MAGEYSKRREEITRRVSVGLKSVDGHSNTLTSCFDIFKLIHKLVDDTNAVKIVRCFNFIILLCAFLKRWPTML